MHSTIRKINLLLFATLIMTQLWSQSLPDYHGQLIFTSKETPATEVRDSSILRAITFTNKSNLFITVFLKRTLSSYLSELAPGISLDSLSKIGNYQFSFIVDDHLIYRTELLPGAPRPAQQQTDTVWSKPLIDNQNEGVYWSQSAWNRFMYYGGDSALSDGQHSLRIEFRPYVKTSTLLVGNLIAVGQLNMLVKRKPDVDLTHTILSPLKSYDGISISRDSIDVNRLKILKAYTEADVFRHITSIVVLKKGQLLFEEYFNGSTRDSLHDVRSVGKTFASTLTGMALRDGYLKSVKQTLGDFYNLNDYPSYSVAKKRVTLNELLTMSSRFDGDDDDSDSPGNEENMYPQGNWVQFTLGLPMDTARYHGQWHYFTAGVMLLGSTLNKVIPGGLDKYADSKLFKPLHITHYKWQYTPQGAPNTAGGIQMNALDFAKYGQLYANGGKWNGKQILPLAWVKETLSPQLPITGRANEFYGYLFWNKTYHTGGKNYEAYYCSGNGGNKIYVFKNVPLVVVITATAYGSGYAHRQADKIVEEYILPAVFRKSL